MAETEPRERTSLVKRVLIGRAMASERLEHTLLPKILALPVFSSDPMSSVAYATEEIMIVLLLASATGKHLVFPIAIAIAILLAIVVTSYRQTVRAYPSGGGAYIVSRENLGEWPGLVAASALLVDYVMTVVVSVVAGVYAITSAAPGLVDQRVLLSVGFVTFITLANLRGVRESGTLFAIPTYGFIVVVLTMVALGVARCVTGCPAAEAIEPGHGVARAAGPISLFVILHAFSSGSTALTGVEAISNGVPAFRRPQAKNAAETLAIMGTIAITMFLGISWLATHIPNITVSDDRTVIAQIGHTVFGGGIGFYVLSFFTAAILVLAANTAYQDFPRLSAILARDHYMPRQFMNRGDRLVFSNGVIGLGVFSSAIIVIFHANLTQLIQLYIVGVFTSFTLSQSGMVRHWLRERDAGTAPRGWKRSIVINTVGAVTTGVVLVIITSTKFVHGAWLSITAMLLLMPTFWLIHRHYQDVQRQLRRGTVRPGADGVNHVVLVVRGFDAATAEAVGVVRSIRPTYLHTVFPTEADQVPPETQDRWRGFSRGARALEPLPLAGGGLLEALRRYVRAIDRQPDDFVNVVLPEMIEGSLVAYLFRRAAIIRVKASLLRERNIVVTDVPVVVEDGRPLGADASPLIPERTVALSFVSGVNDAVIRAVNYAETLEALETRAIYFDLDPEASHRMQQEWGDAGMRIPLDIVEAPFRDLRRPMLEEVRRFTSRHGTLVIVVVPEFIVSKWRHLLLHNQNALFVKRLFLFEPNVILSSVPFVLEDQHPRELPLGGDPVPERA
jgi:amino acid transporter